ncbi:hypothetical protein C8Q75DRAFT_804355 [Abortiporus biennis]|nr:hypothetical protein C8Q75DRAFT_804355 [Abortiporus biennis]
MYPNNPWYDAQASAAAAQRAQMLAQAHRQQGVMVPAQYPPVLAPQFVGQQVLLTGPGMPAYYAAQPQLFVPQPQHQQQLQVMYQPQPQPQPVPQKPERNIRRRMVPMNATLSSKEKERIYFTSDNSPALSLKESRNNPRALDYGDRQMRIFTDRRVINWVFQWPGYSPRSQQFEIDRSTTLWDLAKHILTVVENFVSTNPRQDLEKNKWALGEGGIKADRVWLASLGLIEGAQGWWAPEFEVDLQAR